MKKKIVGIYICMLLIFSSLPLVSGVNLDKNIKELLLKTNGANYLINETMIFILYGRIVYNGEEIHNGYMCYNFTPINVILVGLWWTSDKGFFIRNEKVTEDPCYIAQTDLIHGFVGKNYMFLLGFGFY